MVDLSPAWNYEAAFLAFLKNTPIARYRIDGTAAPGGSFTVHQRNYHYAFNNTENQITLPAAGDYRLQIVDSVWSDGTANPETITVDLLDAGIEVGSYSVQRPSADPAQTVRLSEPELYVEDTLSLTGPIEFRNGGSNTQHAALALRLWQVPSPFPRPDPLAMFARAYGRVRAGKAYEPFGPEEQYLDSAGKTRVRPVSKFNWARVPFGWLPMPSTYRIQASGTLTNLSASPATLSLKLYDGAAPSSALVHTETIEADGSEVCVVSIDETFELPCGWVEIRNGRADDLQAANLLLKIWRTA